jgi:hypothetical protein
MRRTAMVLSVVALITAALFYWAQYFPFPSVGFEWMLYVGVLTASLNVLSSVAAVVICVVLYLRSNVRLKLAFSCAVVAGIALWMPAGVSWVT